MWGFNIRFWLSCGWGSSTLMLVADFLMWNNPALKFRVRGRVRDRDRVERSDFRPTICGTKYNMPNITMFSTSCGSAMHGPGIMLKILEKTEHIFIWMIYEVKKLEYLERVKVLNLWTLEEWRGEQTWLKFLNGSWCMTSRSWAGPRVGLVWWVEWAGNYRWNYMT